MTRDKIIFRVGNVEIKAQLRNTSTAKNIAAALPISSSAQTWGEEVYFSVPVNADLEDDAKSVVDTGEIAFWVEGNCIAIGFGPTPISQGDEIRLAAETNIFADAIDDVRSLKVVNPGEPITVDWDK